MLCVFAFIAQYLMTMSKKKNKKAFTGKFKVPESRKWCNFDLDCKRASLQELLDLQEVLALSKFESCLASDTAMRTGS